MNNNFKQIYLHMLFEEAGKIQFDLNQFKKFLENGTKFKDGKIINEQKDLLIDITSDLFNYCYDHQNEVISFEKIKQLMKESKHYRNIKNVSGKDLYFNIFDFNNQLEIKSFIFKAFNLREDNELFLMAFEIFNQTCKNLGGFFSIYNDLAICLVNSSANRIVNDIYHQLSHYIQTTCNIRLIKDFKFDYDKIESNKRFQSLKKLGVTVDDLNYYFSSSEYATHVDDLIIGLWNTFEKYYKNKADVMHKFFIEVNTAIIDNENFNKSKFLQQYSLANNGDIAPLIMYVASYYFNHKYQKIKNDVQFTLTKKFNQLKE